MILSTPQMSRVHHLAEYDPNIAVSSYKLERIKSWKLLGVHINEHLKSDDHIKHTASGCYASLSILRKLKYLAKYELRKQLAETLPAAGPRTCLNHLRSTHASRNIDFVKTRLCRSGFLPSTTPWILTSLFATSSVCCRKFCTWSLC